MADNRIALSSNAMGSFQACNSSLGFSNSSLGPSEFCSLPPVFENRQNWISQDKHTAIYMLPALGDQLRFCDKQQRLNSTENLTLAFAPRTDPVYKNYRSNFVRDFQQLIRELLRTNAAADGGKEKCRFYGRADDDGGKKKKGFHGRADDDGGKKKKGFHGGADDDGDEGFHGSNPESDDYYDDSGAADDDDDGKDKYGFHGSNPISDDYYDGSAAAAAAADDDDDDDDGKDKCGFLSSDEDPRLILTRCINAWDKRKLKPFWLGFLMLFVYLLHRIAYQNQALIFTGLGFFCGFCDNHVVMLFNYHEIITVTVMAVVILTLWFFWLFVGSITSFFVSLLILLIICICMDENTWPNRY